jgi:hypothetical protein
LAVLLRRSALSSTAQDTSSVQDICRLLHVLISVRGYKTVVRFFPHEASDLERVLQVCLCNQLLQLPLLLNDWMSWLRSTWWCGFAPT